MGGDVEDGQHEVETGALGRGQLQELGDGWVPQVIGEGEVVVVAAEHLGVGMHGPEHCVEHVVPEDNVGLLLGMRGTG